MCYLRAHGILATVIGIHKGLFLWQETVNYWKLIMAGLGTRFYVQDFINPERQSIIGAILQLGKTEVQRQ